MLKRYFVGIPILTIVLVIFALYTGLKNSTGIHSGFINGSVLSMQNANIVKPWARIELKPVVSGFRQPTYLTIAKDGSGNIFVVEKEGRVKIIKKGMVLSTPFLDIVSKVRSKESERGLFSVAFHPNYRRNGRFFVNYTNLNGDTVISEYKVGINPDNAEIESEKIILTIKQPASNHNGGQLQFGPDGYLYIGMGDGGGAGDYWGNAQNKKVLLGKMLRIDIDGGEPYGIPKNNPYVGSKDKREEIWAIGLRNPWRFSFDSLTGDIYIADVGEHDWEEINFQAANSNSVANYGWNLMEGFHDFKLPKGYNKNTLTMPVLEYGHNQNCSVTGGYVYRGKRYSTISGTYFFSDFCSGKIWGLRRNQKQEWEWTEFLDTRLMVSSFGQDEDGEIYVLDFKTGDIYHLDGVGK